MSEKACNCNCAAERAAQFTELAPTLEKYAKVPGSLITILQKTQEIYGYLSVDSTTFQSVQEFDRQKFTVWQHSMHSSDCSLSVNT